MIKKILIIAVAVFVLLAILHILYNLKFKKYNSLINGAINTKLSQKMLVVKAIGDPNIIGKDAFGTLFKVFFKIKAKGKKMTAPVARWPKPFETPINEWLGIYGIAIPNNVISLPEFEKKPGFDVSIETWQYGSAAEILHKGSYSSEAATIEKLKKLITEKGYKIVGPHEEEYLRGPSMFFKRNPKNYLTILRFEVEKTK